MYQTLNAGAIGVKTNGLAHAIELAAKHGFAGVEVWMPEAADLAGTQGADSLKALFAKAKVRPGGWFLPDAWRGKEEGWKQMLADLPRLAKTAQALGCARCATYIWPASDEMPFDKFFAWHVARLKPAVRVLAEHGCTFGLEFIGPKTSWAAQKHPFIHTLEGMLDLATAIGPGAGILYDCWHWYTSHGTVAQIEGLKAEQVVYVHVNDAPAGIPADEQMDLVRKVVGETGVIDIRGFLGALEKIGYDGPVVCEPFSKELKALPDDDARLKTVKAGLDKVFKQAGLAG